MHRPNVCVITLGCAKNTVDSEVLLGRLARGKVPIVEDVEAADVAVINTCGFIEAAKEESLEAVAEAIERKRRGQLRRIVMMGCLTERYRDELAAELPEVDAIYGVNRMSEIAAFLGTDDRWELVGERRLTTPSHYAYLKISDGCDRPCSFCAIPLMRGPYRSRPQEELLQEASVLASRGVRELIVIAQDSTFYGLDRYGERRLGSLLQGLSGIGGIEWIRLLYAHPAGFPRDILSVFREHRQLCRSLDIPLQHIAPRVLRSMRRGITADATRRLLDDIRSAVPDIALRTTLIVGYPEETDHDFEQLVDFVREMRFHRLGVFTYSHEDGTAAESLGDRIPPHVKEERRRVVMELQQELSEERNAGLIGSELRVIVDRLEAGMAVGRTEWDAPEIDQEVLIRPARGIRVGTFLDVRVTGATEYDVEAEPVPAQERRRILYEEQSV
jgi:ribosomal protein S12 methylthiotransferase